MRYKSNLYKGAALQGVAALFLYYLSSPHLAQSLPTHQLYKKEIAVTVGSDRVAAHKAWQHREGNQDCSVNSLCPIRGHLPLQKEELIQVKYGYQ